jgi:hypothetical protein
MNRTSEGTMAMRILAFALSCALLCPASSSLALSYDESSSGDLSGDRLAPTSLSFDPGSNAISGSTTQGDLDYVTIFAPASIVAIVLTDYASTNDVSFVALQAGTTFTEPNTGTNAENLLGWTHFGPGTAGDLDIDLLPVLGSAIPAIGFTGPLPAGSYTFWIQQTSAAPTDYRFAFIVPEPGAALLLALLGGALLGSRRAR